MFRTGDAVRSEDGTVGTVTDVVDNDVEVMFTDNSTEVFSGPPWRIRPIEQDFPAPSEGPDPVHASMLQHARDAGWLEGALVTIRREIVLALNPADGLPPIPAETVLRYIDSYALDVLDRINRPE